METNDRSQIQRKILNHSTFGLFHSRNRWQLYEGQWNIVSGIPKDSNIPSSKVWDWIIGEVFVPVFILYIPEVLSTMVRKGQYCNLMNGPPQILACDYSVVSESVNGVFIEIKEIKVMENSDISPTLLVIWCTLPFAVAHFRTEIHSHLKRSCSCIEDCNLYCSLDFQWSVVRCWKWYTVLNIRHAHSMLDFRCILFWSYQFSSYSSEVYWKHSIHWSVDLTTRESFTCKNSQRRRSHNEFQSILSVR